MHFLYKYKMHIIFSNLLLMIKKYSNTLTVSKNLTLMLMLTYFTLTGKLICIVSIIM